MMLRKKRACLWNSFCFFHECLRTSFSRNFMTLLIIFCVDEYHSQKRILSIFQNKFDQSWQFSKMTLQKCPHITRSSYISFLHILSKISTKFQYEISFFTNVFHGAITGNRMKRISKLKDKYIHFKKLIIMNIAKLDTFRNVTALLKNDS